jgi:OTU domain-containing protein 6
MSDDDSSNAVGRTEPSRDALLAQQTSELSEFTKRAERMRMGVPRKDRAGKMRLAEELAELEQAMGNRHKEELLEAGVDIDARSIPTEHDGHVGETVRALSGVHIRSEVNSSQSDPMGGNDYNTKPKESKAAKRRRQRVEADAASERRIAEEKAGMGPSERSIEAKRLLEILTPLGLTIYDIPPDGHCLFAAVAHQMHVVGQSGDAEGRLYDVARLRDMTAKHMLRQKEDYLPFLETVEFDDEKFVTYCERLRREAVWGGQVELRALSEALGLVIEIYGAAMPLLVMGDVDAKDVQSKPILRLSFHRKYYELGDHYNSVVASDAAHG